MSKIVDLEFMGGSPAGQVAVAAFASSGNAYPTSRLLDGSRDHGYAEEWAEPGTIEHQGERVTVQRIYLFDAADIAEREAEDYPWDDEHTARIVIVESEMGVAIYGSEAAERLGAAIYHYRSAEHDGGARLAAAWERLEAATRECTQREREHVLRLVGPQTMATLPTVGE